MTLKVMLAQKARDEGIQQLVGSLDDLLDFILYSEVLKVFEPSTSDLHDLISKQIQNLKLITEQITECAHFIIGYTQAKSSGKLSKHCFSFCQLNILSKGCELPRTLLLIMMVLSKFIKTNSRNSDQTSKYMVS